MGTGFFLLQAWGEDEGIAQALAAEGQRGTAAGFKGEARKMLPLLLSALGPLLEHRMGRLQ